MDQDGVQEDTFRLSCGHEFHKVRLSQTSVCPLLILFSPLQFCIRGWVTLSKKQTCPYCHEMLDLKRMFPKPWDKPLMMYGKLLSLVQWLFIHVFFKIFFCILFIFGWYMLFISIIMYCGGGGCTGHIIYILFILYSFSPAVLYIYC